MAQEVGKAYVTVMPSAQGFGKAVEGEIDSGLGGAQKRADKGFMGMAKKAGKWGLAAVAAAGAAITGLAVKGGISRALNIEDAQAKLKGLGHDAKTVDQIMVDALASVKGTAYGLDTAATVAASAVAAGIEPGKELEHYLRLTADAATIAGVGMDEMGDIMNKVAVKGRVSMREINQFQERGIPIMQMLADEYGVTAEAMEKMVSNGEVDAARFQKALEEGVGGAALASGDTTRGAFANMGAALSRLGLTVVQPFVDNAKDLFNELTTIIDGLNERIGPFAERFSEMFGGKMADSLDGFGERFLATFDKVTAAISDFFSGGIDFGGLFESLISGLQNGIAQAADWLASGGIQTIVGAILAGRSAIMSAAVTVLMGLVEALPAILPALTDSLTLVVSTVAALLPTIVEAGIQLFMGLVQALVQVVPILLEQIIGMIPMIVELLVSMIPILIESAILLFNSLIEALVIVIPMLIEALVEAIPVVIEALLSMIPELLDGAIELFTALIDSLPIILPLLLTAIVNLLPSIISSVLSMLPKLLSSAIELFLALVQAIPRVLPQLLLQIVLMLPQILQSVLSMIPQLLSTAVELFSSLVEAIPQVIPKILSGLKEVGPKLVSTIKTMIPQMMSAGKDLLLGLATGLGNAVGAVVNKAKEVAGKIVGAVKGFFGISSPSKLFRDEVGAELVAGLTVGLQDDDAALRASRQLSEDVADAFSGAPLSASGHFTAAASAAGGGGSGGTRLDDYTIAALVAGFAAAFSKRGQAALLDMRMGIA